MTQQTRKRTGKSDLHSLDFSSFRCFSLRDHSETQNSEQVELEQVTSRTIPSQQCPVLWLAAGYENYGPPGRCHAAKEPMQQLGQVPSSCVAFWDLLEACLGRQDRKPVICPLSHASCFLQLEAAAKTKQHPGWNAVLILMILDR